ncbi:MAG TPA: alcohol dehydrogenase catalytic domain-containing protein [Steroidobacteraceae bacterium]|nr:alcohol dehydrogenase catalytic domain-containing protein [Steroidobacteraceae bacterium]
MKAIKVGAQPGLEHLQLVELSEPQGPGHGEIRVRVHASSLNYHDYGVAKRGGPKHTGRILMADGAGVVEAVGEGVTEFKKGDSRCSRNGGRRCAENPRRNTKGTQRFTTLGERE